jgi:DNA-binding transcriptional MerR regulator
MKKIPPKTDCVGTKEAAALLGVSISAVDHYAQDGRLPSFPCPCGAGRMFLRDDVLSFVKPIRGRPKRVRI